MIFYRTRIFFHICRQLGHRGQPRQQGQQRQQGQPERQNEPRLQHQKIENKKTPRKQLRGVKSLKGGPTRSDPGRHEYEKALCVQV